MINQPLATWLDCMTGSARILRNGFKKSSRSANSLEKEEIFGKMPKTARKMQALPELRKRSNIRWVCWSGLLAAAAIGMMKVQAQEPLPQISFTPGAAGTWNASWQGVAGRTYFSQWSTDLETWKYAPLMEFGAGAKSFGMATNGLPKFFTRLRFHDDFSIADLAAAESADFDYDGLSNWQEVAARSTDPLNRDTDGDSLPDGWEVMYGLSPLDNGSVNPANGINGIFPGSTSTNGFAYINLPNVQTLAGGTLENFDGDLALNDQDSDPTDNVVDWPPVEATSYAVIPLGEPYYGTYRRDYVSINAAGSILISTGGGRWTGFDMSDPVITSNSPSRLWKNGSWMNLPEPTVNMVKFGSDNPLNPTIAYNSYTAGPAQCGNYIYEQITSFRITQNHILPSYTINPASLEYQMYRRNTATLTTSAPVKISNLTLTDGLDFISASDGSFAETKVTFGPHPCQTKVWFPPANDPYSSYVPGVGSPALTLPNNYIVGALDASGAVLAYPKTTAGNLPTLLFDNGVQSMVPAETNIPKYPRWESGPWGYGYGAVSSWGGDNILSRVTFGPYNGQSRILIGGKYVKNSSGVSLRKKLPFTDAFTNSSYNYLSDVTDIANNGVMLGRYYSWPVNQAFDYTKYRHAIWRDGKTIPLADLIEPSLPSGSFLRTTSIPRYSNVVGHAMNDSGMIVVSAEDAQNPTPPVVNSDGTTTDLDPLLLGLPKELAPEVLTVNSDFDEGRIDPATGYAIPDCDDMPGVDLKTGAGNTQLELGAQRNHLDGKFTQGQTVVDDLHKGWFGVNPKVGGDEFWAGANVTIRKVDKIDEETGYQESGQVRFYAKWEGGGHYGIAPYDFETLQPVNLVTGGVNGNNSSVYGTSSTIPDGAQFYMEGVRPGKITLEWRLQKGTIDVKHEQTFKVETRQSVAAWQEEVRYQIRLQTKVKSGTEVDVALYHPGNGFRNENAAQDNVLRVVAIYDYYQQLFKQMPEKFMWAGMAKVAAAPIYAGMSDLHTWWIATGVTPPWPPYQGPGDRDYGVEIFIEGLLLSGQNKIFKDKVWAHRAYKASGIGAINYIDNLEVNKSTDYNAWRTLDSGIHNDNQNMIFAANGNLLRREQQDVVQQNYDIVQTLQMRQPPAHPNINGGVTVPVDANGLANAGEWLSANSNNNPLPGGPAFRTTVPNGRLDFFNDRWAWTSNAASGMLQIWTGASTSVQGFGAARRASENEKTIKAAATPYSYDPSGLP